MAKKHAVLRGKSWEWIHSWARTYPCAPSPSTPHMPSVPEVTHMALLHRHIDLGFRLQWMEYLVGSVLFNFYYKLQFPLPYNASQLRPALSARRARHESRMRAYSILETTLQQQRFPGRACLLRSICEVAEVPLATGRPEHLFEELLHIVLTPSEDSDDDTGGHDSCGDCYTGEEDDDDSIADEFVAAERLGRDAGYCETAFHDCPVSPLQLFSAMVEL
ncbi:hypothetical protein PR048_003817 [Dryococelus australis]|uniref:Uncharacterized protein n=1 Tax=Dryococelus australis TaxID=614101 RepID=A0ABQ9IPA0_9NEOP|nr:hypothetical protein PR048_003817 [Dryococelus australis]